MAKLVVHVPVISSVVMVVKFKLAKVFKIDITW